MHLYFEKNYVIIDISSKKGSGERQPTFIYEWRSVCKKSWKKLEKLFSNR